MYCLIYKLNKFFSNLHIFFPIYTYFPKLNIFFSNLHIFFQFTHFLPSYTFVFQVIHSIFFNRISFVNLTFARKGVFFSSINFIYTCKLFVGNARDDNPIMIAYNSISFSYVRCRWRKQGDSVIKKLMIFFKMKIIGHCNINDLKILVSPLCQTEINIG